MFERLEARADARAERRAEALADALAAAIAADGAAGIRVGRSGAGVVLSGRGLARRFALDPALRWLMARVR